MILGGEVIWLFLDLISELPSPSLCLKEAQPTRQQVDLNLELPSPSLGLEKTGLPQIQDFEIPDFFKTFSGPEKIFLKTANDRNFTRVCQKISTVSRTCTQNGVNLAFLHF